MFGQKSLARVSLLVLVVLSLGICGSYAQGPTEEDVLKKGVDYSRHDKYDEAISEFNNAIKINPSSANAYYGLGFIYDKKGDLDKAVANFTKAIEIDPALTDAYYNRGFAYYKKGAFDQSISDYGKVIELSPNSADAFYGRGLVYSKKGNLDQAIADFNKAIEVRPAFALAYDALAVAYFSKKDYLKTLANVNKAQALGFKSRPLRRVSADVNSEKLSMDTAEKDANQVLVDKAKLVLDKMIIFSLSVLLGICLLAIVILLKTKKTAK